MLPVATQASRETLADAGGVAGVEGAGVVEGAVDVGAVVGAEGVVGVGVRLKFLGETDLLWPYI